MDHSHQRTCSTSNTGFHALIVTDVYLSSLFQAVSSHQTWPSSHRLLTASLSSRFPLLTCCETAINATLHLNLELEISCNMWRHIHEYGRSNTGTKAGHALALTCHTPGLHLIIVCRIQVNAIDESRFDTLNIFTCDLTPDQYVQFLQACLEVDCATMRTSRSRWAPH